MLQKSLLFLIVWISSFNHIWGQTTQQAEDWNHSAYAELVSSFFTNSLVLNYEPRLYHDSGSGFQLNGRAGLVVGLQYGGDYNIVRGGTGGLTMLLGKGENHFSASSGWVFAWESVGLEGDVRSLSFPLLEVGWRHEHPEKRTLTKVSVGTLGLSIGLGIKF